MKKLLVSLLAMVAIFFSCTKVPLFSGYRTMPENGWDKDSILTFSFNITDTTATYDVMFSIRHTVNYPYQNLWLFTNQDTMEIFLADQRGEWLGNGRGTLREMPVIYKQAIRFPHSGDYTISLQQGMRTNCLKGISDIGVIINKQ